MSVTANDDRVFLGSYDVLPWQDIPLWNKTSGRASWSRQKLVVEPPPKFPVRPFSETPEPVMPVALVQHVLDGHIYRWGHHYAEMFWEAGDERVFRSLALFWLASRLLEWVAIAKGAAA